MKHLITNPFFLALVCFAGGAALIPWLWFSLFDFGDFWAVEGDGLFSIGITPEGQVGLLVGATCGGLAYARSWAFCRWH